MQKLRVCLVAAATLGAAVLFYNATPATADVTAVSGTATPAFIGATTLAPPVSGSANEASGSYGPIGSGAGLLPSGVVHDLLTRGPQIGLAPPATLDLRFMALTFGMMFKVNVVGILGILLAAVALRRL